MRNSGNEEKIEFPELLVVASRLGISYEQILKEIDRGVIERESSNVVALNAQSQILDDPYNSEPFCILPDYI